MRALVAVVVLFVLAGCTSSTSTPAATSETTGAAPTTAPRMAHQPLPHVATLTADGTLTATAGGCVVPANACEFQSAAPDQSTFLLAAAGNLTAVTATITWTAATPATNTLAVGVSIQGGNGTFLGSARGTSPLTFSWSSGTTPPRMADGDVVRFFVYNAGGVVAQDPVPAYGYATPEQAFHVVAAATVLA